MRERMSNKPTGAKLPLSLERRVHALKAGHGVSISWLVTEGVRHQVVKMERQFGTPPSVQRESSHQPA